MQKSIKCNEMLSGTDWGASRNGLRNIYVALIRSVLDYGCFIYGRASKSVLKKKVIQAQALRVWSF